MARKAISIYLETEDVEKLDKLAVKHSRSRNRMVEFLVKTAVKTDEFQSELEK